ncbi:AraC family transcriptional regulator [Flavobacterium gilvum]|uniref:AraC family transcriptional regulator n=1 Tax=Flavobacterium gilvum TaxID=1492737 RepID=A0AAC9N5H5_9FLAO|nr:AraC family transcriptional regulator [Flavobacterium gilvum]AOW09417.1 AraC family transcriptional regulator [Flavobacterium gilvum]KFC60503.1 AraC family transcriptional regulator [Flavobacterium gilvum]
MKIKKEEITIQPGKSFRIFTPSFRNYFLWHYHPEFELVYVEAVAGIRHVGKNISSFIESDLVLIGSNVPHLNFDYGLQTEYKQIVVQFKEDFFPNLIIPTAEFGNIRALFDKAYLGLSFYGKTKEQVVAKLKEMQSKNNFNSLLELFEILNIMAESSEVHELNTEDTRIKMFINDKIRMGTVYNYIHENYGKNPNVNHIASIVHLSTAAFCRYFKKQTNMTFTEFVNQYRISQAKTLLLKDHNVSEVGYAVGFESMSYFNKLFKTLVGETPSSFKKNNAFCNKLDNRHRKTQV